MTDLTTQTPVEVDEQIAAIYVRYYEARHTMAVQAHYLDDAETRLDQMEAGTYRHFFTEHDVERTRESVDSLRAKVADLADAAAAIMRETAPFNVEWVRRGCWSRFWLVDNGHGHVHRTMGCSTTYPTTEWVWLPEYSGSDEAGVVALAKSQACTVCFPSAPVDKRRGSIENPAKRKSRLEREAAKAERDAAKAAKAIANPDGSPLEVFDWTFAERTYRERDGSTRTVPAHDRYETLATLAAAKSWLTGSQETYGSRKRPEDVQRVADAIAAKVGTSAADEIAAAVKRAAKRR